MKRFQKEIIKLTAKEVLFSIFDLATPFFEANRIYQVPVKKYLENREFEKSNYLDKINYLKKHGLIESFVEGKEKYIEITQTGIDKIRRHQLDEDLPRPEIWDGKWRVVIFDIPNKKNSNRDIFRRKLIRMNFEKVQESVYVYPFECTKPISLLSSNISIENNVIIMVSEIIQGEDVIIEKFLNKNILTKEDLMVNKIT